MDPLQGVTIGAVTIGWVALVWALVTRARQGGRVRSRDARSLVGMALQGVGIGLAFSDPEGWSGWDSLTALRAAGAIGLAGAGAILFVGAVRTLGKQWSLTARVLEDHELVTTGPYALVRHPIYTGLLALLLATGLAQSGFFETAVAALVYLAGTLLRIRREERLLRETFGPAYEAYARRVPALFPRPGGTG